MPRFADRPSPNHDARPTGQTVDILLLHYTDMESAEAALERLCDPSAKVSAHYCVDEDGTVTRLVGEDRRAWHAGAASWAGASDINAARSASNWSTRAIAADTGRFPRPR